MRYLRVLATHGMTLAMLAGVLAACVPVTVNIAFPQEKLDAAARTIEDTQAQPSRPPSPAPGPSGGGPSVSANPRTDSRSPEVVKARQSRRSASGRSVVASARRTRARSSRAPGTAAAPKRPT